MLNQPRADYNPPRLRDALAVTRLANANWGRAGGLGTRFTVAGVNIHEAVIESNISVYDSVSKTYRTVEDVMYFLPNEDLKRVSQLADSFRGLNWRRNQA